MRMDYRNTACQFTLNIQELHNNKCKKEIRGAKDLTEY
jgi:hypothetical protein